MKKFLREEKLLNASITEFLLLFLFIFLAIASIQNKIINEKTSIIEENQLIDIDEVAISQDDKALLDSFKYEIEELNKILVPKEDFTDYEEWKDSLDKVADFRVAGVAPPPCEGGLGSNRLFQIELLSGLNYKIKFKNLSNPIITTNYTIYNDTIYNFNQNDFVEFAIELHDSKLINETEPICDVQNNPKWRNDKDCIECKYYGTYFEKDYSEKRKESKNKQLEIDILQDRIDSMQKIFDSLKDDKQKIELRLRGQSIFSNRNSDKEKLKLIKKDISKQNELMEELNNSKEELSDEKKQILKILNFEVTHSERKKMTQTIDAYFGAATVQ